MKFNDVNIRSCFNTRPSAHLATSAIFATWIGPIWVALSVGLFLSIGSTTFAATQTVTYGWEDGASVLTTRGTVLAANVTDDPPNVVYAGSRALRLIDNCSGSDTPAAVVAWVHGLQAGQTVTASIWCYDTTTPGTATTHRAPSGRLWAYYADNADSVRHNDGFAGQGSIYSGAIAGWNLLTYTWTIPEGHTGLAIEVRTYTDDQDTIWVDDLSVTAPDTTTIDLPRVSMTGANKTELMAVGEADKIITLAGETDGAGVTLNWRIVGGLRVIDPTWNTNTCRLYDTQGTPETTDDINITTTGGILANHGNQIRFHAGDSGLYALTYRVENAENSPNPSPDYTVFIGVQSGRAVITEIMAQPRHFDYDIYGGHDYSHWQWVEIHNVSNDWLDLDSLQTPSTLVQLNLSMPAYMGPGQTKILALKAVQQKWLTEWNGLYRPAPPAVPAVMSSDMIVFDEAGTGVPKPILGTEDSLFLFDYDSSELLDAVCCKNGKEGWPASTFGSSLFLEYGKLNSVDNDNGANWKTSRPQANGTYQTLGLSDDGSNRSDRGSPMILPTSPTIVPPDARDVSVTMSNNATPYAVALNAIPAAGTSVAHYTILNLPTAVAPTATSPAVGTLTNANGNPITSAPYILPAPTSDGQPILNFTPSRAGLFTFTYQATDSQGAVSNIATVNLYVQSINRVFITEIMYSPRNTPASDWNWIEIYNASANAVSLGSLTNTYDQFANNLPANTSIAAGATMILAPDVAIGRTQADFLAEWARPSNYAGPTLSASNVIFVPKDRFPSLSSTTSSSIRLYATDGSLLDTVTYRVDSPWPSAPRGSSIFLKPAHMGSLANDDGANWTASQDSVLLAYTTPTDPSISSNNSDVGSPAAIPFGYPVVNDLTVMTTIQPTLFDIQLKAEPVNTTYIVTPLQAIMPTTSFVGVHLMDAQTDDDMTSGGTLTNRAGQLRLVFDKDSNPMPAGAYRFTYHAANGSLISNEATVNIFVQKGSVIVTEMMIGPANDSTQWGWIELMNRTNDDVILNTWQDANQSTSHIGNLGKNSANQIIPARSIAIIAKGIPTDGNMAYRLGSTFLSTWAPLSPAQVIWVPTSMWPQMNSNGGTLLIFEAAGVLADAVQYGDAANGWPKSSMPTNGSASLYLDCLHLSAAGNDVASAWSLSRVGIDGAWANPNDIGSPGIVTRCSPPADFNRDGAVDELDLAFFLSCAAGPGIAVGPECQKADLDGDTDVDWDDFGIFQRCLTLPGFIPDPDCGD